MSQDHVVGEKKGTIFYITLNRSDKRNAINFDMFIAIAEILEDVIIDPEIRAIILKGEGKIFSSGIDINSLLMLVDRYSPEHASGGAPIRADIIRYQRFFTRLQDIEIPVICAMHSMALGVAVELALACDIRLMSDDCRWGLPEGRFGVIPDMGGIARLSRLIGSSRTMEVLSTGNLYTAEQALDWGLASYLFPKEKLFEEAEKLARDIAQSGPLAVGAIKKVVTKGADMDLMTQLDMEANFQSMLLKSEDFMEGIQSTMKKRAPRWKRK